MALTQKTVPVSTTLLIALLAGLMSVQAFGRRPQMMASPTAVAVVDLARLQAGLTERTDAETKLMALRQAAEDEADARRGELEAMQKTLANEPAGPELAAKTEELERGIIELQYWLELQREQLDVEFSLELQGLYVSIRESAAEMAQADGWDIIIVDDSNGVLGLNPESRMTREAQIRQQIRSRKVIYANDPADVTDELIQRMNNRYAAGG